MPRIPHRLALVPLAAALLALCAAARRVRSRR